MTASNRRHRWCSVWVAPSNQAVHNRNELCGYIPNLRQSKHGKYLVVQACISPNGLAQSKHNQLFRKHLT